MAEVRRVHRWPVGEAEVQNLLDDGELQEVVQEALEAQLGPNTRKVVRPFRTLRLRRHDSEYPGGRDTSCHRRGSGAGT